MITTILGKNTLPGQIVYTTHDGQAMILAIIDRQDMVELTKGTLQITEQQAIIIDIKPGNHDTFYPGKVVTIADNKTVTVLDYDFYLGEDRILFNY